MITDYIVAQCTPHGKGAIALLRFTGSQIKKFLCNAVELKSNIQLSETKSHTIHFGTFYDPINKNPIDFVLFLVMDAPRTFTGEDTIEITCHNNPFIISEIIRVFCSLGGRIAKPGEFTRLAYENKKIDLLQAEAIHDLICAQNELETKAALSQLDGSLSKEINQIQDKIVRITAWAQANFEFLDEERDFTDSILKQVNEVIESINSLLKDFLESQKIKEGIQISLIGKTNVGKSSLFNTLLNKEKAIVTSIEGTTRDSLESSLYKNGLFYTLVDTAGIRESEDIIEREGIDRAKKKAQEADLILLIIDLESPLNQIDKDFYKNLYSIYKNKIILIGNKIDISTIENKKFVKSLSPDHIFISAKYKTGITELFEKIDIQINYLSNKKKLPYLINIRHKSELDTLLNQLIIIKELISKPMIYYELVIAHLHESLIHLSGLTGKSITEETLDMVFKEFCVGK
jgi:tRNA modification GTPase